MFYARTECSCSGTSFVGIVLENMIVKQQILSDTLWGMPYMVLLAEALAYLGYRLVKQHLWLRGAGAEHTPESQPVVP